MSHFAQSDRYDILDTQKQVKNFEEAQKILINFGIKPRYIHIENFSGILNNKMYKNVGNMARAGLATYGIDLQGKDKNLRPALSLKTHIAQIKKIKKGEKIGYDFTYTLKKDTEIAILPAGYNDGVDRWLSNKGFVKVKGKFCQIIGRVSMNITTVDVSNVKSINIGDEVIVYSNNPSDKNSIQNSAKICNTIPYEILIHLNPSTKRILI